MTPLFLFILGISFSVGMVTYILAIALHRHHKSREVLHFILFLTSILLVMLNAAVLYIVEATSPDAYLAAFVLTYVSRILTVFLSASVVFLVNVMFDILQTRAASAVILAIYAVLVGFDLLIAFTSFRGGSLFPLPFKEFSPEDILVYLSAAYPIVVTILYLKRIENPIVFKLMRAVLIFTLCILPFMVLDEFNISLTLSVGGSSPIMIRSLAFPFFYVVLNFILIYYGFKFYIREESAAAPSSISSEFVKAFRISDREMEVIRLIQEGYSNKEIGEKLFISPATVRNHLHNLFEKTSARNRVDLLRRARGPLAHG